VSSVRNEETNINIGPSAPYSRNVQLKKRDSGKLEGGGEKYDRNTPAQNICTTDVAEMPERSKQRDRG